MTERSSILQRTQIGPETTPGTAVAADTRLQATSIRLKPEGNINSFKPTGTKFNTIAVVGQEWATGDIDGFASYNDLAYLLAGILETPVPVANGTGYDWTFEPRSEAEDDVTTYTIEEGGSVRAHRVTYGLIDALTIDFDRTEVAISGSVIAGRFEDDIQLSTNEKQTLTITGTPTGGTFTITYSGQTTAAIAYNATAGAVQTALEALSNLAVGDVVCTGGPLPDTAVVIEFRGALAQTNVALMTTTDSLTGGTTPASAITETTPGVAPTAIDPAPILANDLCVYMDDTAAGLGVTKLTRVLSGSFAISNRFSPVWAVDCAEDTFVAHVEQEPTVELTLMLEADTQGMGLLSTMRSGDTKFVRIQADGAEIGAGPTTYKFRLDVAGKVSAMPPLSDEDGVYAVEWTFTIVKDATWGKAISCLLTNAVATL